MDILIAATELSPIVKAGGLADVISFLSTEWKRLGQNPIIILPKYSIINTDEYKIKPTDIVLYVPMGNWTEYARLWHGCLPGTDVPIYLVENNDYYNRNGIYGDANEFQDNDKRFIFFSRAIFEVAKAINFYPDIIHAHDYHTAFSMAFLKSWYKFDSRFSMTAGIYTIHNLAYQGKYDPRKAMFYSQFGIEQFYPGSWFEHGGCINLMKIGIMFSDKITTVSPNYAQEIKRPEYGEGLDFVLNFKAPDTIGILNGVNYDEWNPEIDNSLYLKYSSNTLDNKFINKRQYLIEHGVNESDNFNIPLVGMVSRLTDQKGIDILMNLLEYYISNNIFRFTVLGSGEQKYVDYFNYLAAKYYGKALVYIGYNENLSHKIMACSDYLLVPSKFEPCGLTQMYALKYGTIPIVRATGGLIDTVQEYSTSTGEGTGFVFLHYNSDDFAYAIRRAISIYRQEHHWDIIRQNAMKQNFSSTRSALEYLKVFKWAIQKVRQT